MGPVPCHPLGLVWHPTSPQLLPPPHKSSRLQTHGANLYLFKKKKKIFSYCLLFLAQGQAPQFILLSLQTLGFRRRETALPWSQRGMGPFQGHHPRALSLWDGHILQALTISLSMGRRGFLSPSPLPPLDPLQPRASSVGMGVPCPTLSPTTAPCPGQNYCQRRLGPMILGHEGHQVDGREGSAGWNLVVPSPLSRCFLYKQVSSTAAPLPSGLLLCQFVYK